MSNNYRNNKDIYISKKKGLMMSSTKNLLIILGVSSVLMICVSLLLFHHHDVYIRGAWNIRSSLFHGTPNKDLSTKSEELVTTDYAGKSATTWGDHDPTVFVTIILSGGFQVTYDYVGTQYLQAQEIMRVDNINVNGYYEKDYYRRRFVVEDDLKLISENELRAAVIILPMYWWTGSDLQALIDHEFLWAHQKYGELAEEMMIKDLCSSVEGSVVAINDSIGKEEEEEAVLILIPLVRPTKRTSNNGYNDGHVTSSNVRKLLATTSRKLPSPPPPPESPKGPTPIWPMDSYHPSRKLPSPPPPPASPKGPTPIWPMDSYHPSTKLPSPSPPPAGQKEPKPMD